MPFTVKEFPGQRFSTLEEYSEAKKRRKEVEQKLSSLPKGGEDSVVRVTATVLPAPREAIEAKIIQLEEKIEKLTAELKNFRTKAPEELAPGTILRGESQGKAYTLEALEDGSFLCSNGQIYASLSGAALGVSGSRRSGWKFWKVQGLPVGEVVGRFEHDAHSDK